MPHQPPRHARRAMPCHAMPRHAMPRRAMPRLVPGLLAAWLLLTVLLLTVPLPTLARPQALPGQAEPAGQGLAFGDSVIFGKCLKLTAVQVSDRDDPMDRHDWVTLSVSNGCPLPVRHLLVQLALYDAQGNAYGGPVWVLERGIVLPPGRQRMERFAVPDPGQLTAVRWDAQVLTVDAPRARRRR